MRSLAIVALCIAAAVAYGIVHDQVTARVCVEYFTIGHPPVIDSTDPTSLAFVWGIIATWWVGVMLGIPLAIAARAGRRPMRSVRSLLRPIGTLLAMMAAGALLMGLTGYVLARTGAFFLIEPMASAIPRAKHANFLADLWAHSASYFLGFVGGLVVVISVWRSRRHPKTGEVDADPAPSRLNSGADPR